MDSLSEYSFTPKSFEKKQAIVAAGRPKPIERLFSSLKRIKSFSRNKMGQDRLSDFGLISIESQLLTEVIETNSSVGRGAQAPPIGLKSMQNSSF